MSAWLRAIVFGPPQKRLPQLNSLNVDNHVVELAHITKLVAGHMYQHNLENTQISCLQKIIALSYSVAICS